MSGTMRIASLTLGMALALLGGMLAPAFAAPAADPAALSMTSSVSPSPLVVGGTGVYTVTVQNTGTADAANVVTTLPFAPAGAVTIDSSALPSGCATAGQTVTCTEATIPAGGSVTYTITVTNHGPSDAATVTWHDPTNGNLTTIIDYPCNDTGLTVTCDVGTMKPGETRTFTLTVKVNDDVPAGTVITNCATVDTGTRPETNPDNNNSCTDTYVDPVTPVADVEVTKTGPATVDPDQQPGPGYDHFAAERLHARRRHRDLRARHAGSGRNETAHRGGPGLPQPRERHGHQELRGRLQHDEQPVPGGRPGLR
jgi:uncharacterized repeat protein (TIGR01451 family)